MREEDVADHCVCHNLRAAARTLTRAYDEALRPVGLRVTQLTIMVAISLTDRGMAISTLAERMGMDRTTLTRNLRPLEKQGLIEILPEGYRRARGMVLTERGCNLLAEALPLWEAVQATTVERIGAERWRQLRRELAELTAGG